MPEILLTSRYNKKIKAFAALLSVALLCFAANINAQIDTPCCPIIGLNPATLNGAGLGTNYSQTFTAFVIGAPRREGNGFKDIAPLNAQVKLNTPNTRPA